MFYDGHGLWPETDTRHILLRKNHSTGKLIAILKQAGHRRAPSEVGDNHREGRKMGNARWMPSMMIILDEGGTIPVGVLPSANNNVTIKYSWISTGRLPAAALILSIKIPFHYKVIRWVASINLNNHILRKLKKRTRRHLKTSKDIFYLLYIKTIIYSWQT